MSRRKRLMKQTAAAIGLFSLSLATLICSGVAWFTVNSAVNLSYNSMRLFDETEDNIIHDYHFYNCLGVQSVAGTEYVYFDANETESPLIGLYDRELDAHNHQLLIEVEINPDYASIMPYAQADANILPNSSWSDISWTEGSRFPLSAIVAFKVFGTTAPTSSTYNGSNAFQVAYDTSNMDSFVSFGTGGAENPIFTNPIDIDGNDACASYSITPASDGYGRIYLILDYNEDAVSAIYSFNIGNTLFESETALTYMCDFLIAFKEVA